MLSISRRAQRAEHQDLLHAGTFGIHGLSGANVATAVDIEATLSAHICIVDGCYRKILDSPKDSAQLV